MYKLIISIVPHNCGELITSAAIQAGATGGTILMGRGTAQNSILQLLGLGESSKDITFILTETEKTDCILKNIQETTNTRKTHFGVLFTVSVNMFIKSGMNNIMNKGDNNMAELANAQYEMINVIVNKGYAEDAMEAARKAGAGGGTIINARGTAKPGDASFFGIDIVPEKEMLFIITPVDKKETIVNAISSLECFQKTGSGIIFCNQAENFTFLGKQ